MSKPLTIEEVLNEVLKRSPVANIKVSIWKGELAPGSQVAIWDGKAHAFGTNLQSAFAAYLAPSTVGVEPEETMNEALEILNVENPTAAQEEANYQNSL